MYDTLGGLISHSGCIPTPYTVPEIESMIHHGPEYTEIMQLMKMNEWFLGSV